MFKVPPFQRKIPELRIEEVTGFPYGIITAVQPRSIKRGASAGNKNWLTKGDKIELRRGMAFLGTSSVNMGTGKTSGLKKAQTLDGTEILFGTYGKKAKYFNNTTKEWVEVGTDILGSKVVDGNGISSENVSIEAYTNLAGAQVWINSQNCAGIFKILVSHPSDYSNTYLITKNYKGNIKIDTSMTFLWNKITDKTGLYRSYVDSQLFSLTAENPGSLVGDGATKIFSGTLGFRSATLPQTTSLAIEIGAVIGTLISISGIQPDSGMTQVSTSSPHGCSIGDTVVISGVAGMTQINNRIGTIIPQGFGASTFHINIDCSSFTAYSSGGKTGKAEVFTDNGVGVLASNGATAGAGLINYTTGVFSITFNTAPTNLAPIAAYYEVEDSTNGGIADFTSSTPRTVGQGAVYRQDEGGGAIQGVQVYASNYYTFHLTKTWVLNLPTNDTQYTDSPYRAKVGIPNLRASCDTGDGIFYIDDSNHDQVKVRVLTYTTGGSQQVVPISISNNLNLSNYYFDQAAMIQWGDYILCACRQTTSPVNDTVLVYNRVWKAWDILDYSVSVFDIFNGTLVAGDSLTNNFMTLFSGYDDLDNPIDNFWIGNQDNMRLLGMKKVKQFYIEGYIAPDQALDIYVSFDSGDYVLVGTIDGRGTYVDQGQSQDLGAPVLGSRTIGGGASGGNTAYHYERLFNINTDRFEYAQVKYVARKIGYVSIQNQKWWDVRYMGRKSPVKYLG